MGLMSPGEVRCLSLALFPISLCSLHTLRSWKTALKLAGEKLQQQTSLSLWAAILLWPSSSKLRLFVAMLPGDTVCWCMTGLEGFWCLQGENFKLCFLMLWSITCYFFSFPAICRILAAQIKQRARYDQIWMLECAFFFLQYFVPLPLGLPVFVRWSGWVRN